MLPFVRAVATPLPRQPAPDLRVINNSLSGLREAQPQFRKPAQAIIEVCAKRRCTGARCWEYRQMGSHMDAGACPPGTR